MSFKFHDPLLTLRLSLHSDKCAEMSVKNRSHLGEDVYPG